MVSAGLLSSKAGVSSNFTTDKIGGKENGRQPEEKEVVDMSADTLTRLHPISKD